MMFRTGDLVRIQNRYTDLSGQEFGWIGIILSYRGLSGFGGEPEWWVQWAHQSQEAIEYGYYLEVLCK